MIVVNPNHGIKVDAAIVAQPFRYEIQMKVKQLIQQGIEPPLLVGLLANSDPAAQKYAEWTGKACQVDGLRYELRIIDDPIDVEAALMDANDDPKVHGIIVYYPIFGGGQDKVTFSGVSHDDYLRDTVSYKADVEGLCHTYRTNLYRNIRFLDYPHNTQKCLLPCTALSVVKILEACPGCYDPCKPIGRQLEGKIITIINRSEIVGRPLAAMLANDGAEVYSIDIHSIYRLVGNRFYKCAMNEASESCVRKSTIIITGVPTKDYRLPTEWVQPYCTVINVASYKNVDEEALLMIPGVVYVPLVGKVTVAMLERNLVRLFEQFHDPRRHGIITSSTTLTHQSNKREKPSSSSPHGVVNDEQSTIQVLPWYGHALQLYTAIAVTILLAYQIGVNRSK